jgi:hypothetical protein
MNTDETKLWTDEKVKQEILSQLYKWPKWGLANADPNRLLKFVKRPLLKKGIEYKRLLRCFQATLGEENREFAVFQTEVRLRVAANIAMSRMRCGDFDSFEGYFEEFQTVYFQALREEFPERLVKGPAVDAISAGIKEELHCGWEKRLELIQRTRAVAEESQCRRLERVERHRLKRLAEEETARQAPAEEASKRKSEEARLKRKRRKAEAQAWAEQAKERARERAEAKREEWLAAHPRKGSTE